MLQYIGARYVPIFYQNSLDPTSSEWEPNVTYEPMVWVELSNGHMYISKKTVPANIGSPASNPLYWLEAGQYNAYIQHLQDQIDDMNDGTVAGSLQNQINEMNDGAVSGSLQNQITTLDNQINGTGGLADDVADNATAIGLLRNRKFLFIGDSYMTGESAGGVVIDSFTKYFGDYTGLAPQVDYWVSAASGYGFTSHGFENLMISAANNMTAAERASITDIVVCGGINDATLISNSMSDFRGLLSDFVTSAKTRFSNAKIRVGYISKDYVGRLNLNRMGINAYQYITRFGGYYLSGVENILRGINQFYTDGHPNANGQKSLGQYIIDALEHGYCNPGYPDAAINITPQSGITIVSNELTANALNGNVTISAHNWSTFQFASRSFTSPTDPLYVGPVTSSYPIGDAQSYKYIPVTLVIIATGGPFQLEGKLLFQNKGVYIFPWQQLTPINGCTEIRIAPFSHTFSSSDI